VSDALFVYGTLRSEFDNPFARKLRGEADLVGRATVRGSIFRIADYPGYRREPDGVVHGELWHLRDPERTLAALDDYEGPEYSRVMIDVQPLEPSAWIYLYIGNVRADKRIASGDFLVP
jgi:gamma-glutamylcyclotransferase (GGCT)/AIG2-like uncharacterized protein YtfP